MTMPAKRTLLFLETCLLTASTSAVFASAQESPSDFGIFDWIQSSEGGYFNPKQEFRYETPGDSSTLPGIFAKEDIKKGDVLITIPWDLILKSDDEEETGQMCCGTVKALAREMKLGAESKLAPYVQYLNAQPDGELPSSWSEAGQNLLRRIVGGPNVKDTEIPPGEPTEWLESDWYTECNGDRSDELSAKAALLVVQRSDDYFMIPGYDMYNHRNGKKWLNTRTITTIGEKQDTVATRNIPAGTQIYISYNKCAECEGRETEYGVGEILRDYGFIEHFPQTWHYLDANIQFDLDKHPTDGHLFLKWEKDSKPDTYNHERTLVHLYRQIRRLRQVRNLSKFDPDIPKIPQHELDLIWQFQEANIVAMNVAIETIEGRFGRKNETGSAGKVEEVCRADDGCDIINASHYDLLGLEFDDLDYSSPSCDNADIMDFEDYNLVEEMKTSYQQVNFAIHPDDGDICMDIEDIVQICSVYRPQYHEYMVHGATRFLDSVKRVIFIGGGDSMLLHEALKYPSLELVVGLELDQVVVRKSFKYFKTQPHFDDERVEWWFGDATKSLLLLQEEYWQSFDLVLIDLSETAMSLPVTDELDVYDAMGLLLKPDGVMVKNELYMDSFSDSFDYSTQIYYESPIICSQALVMGSNSVDFLTATPKDHEIDTLLYESLHTPENHLDYLHDYRRNDAIAQGKCGDLKIPEIPTKQQKAAGIVAIVNAEKTTVPLDGSAIAETIRGVMEAEGFSSSSVPVVDSGSVYAIMKEGYIVARLFPEDQYCAFDINLWGSFQKLKGLQTALVEAVGSTAVSSYRVVVGGMFGSSTWKEDLQLIGPQIVQTRNCEAPEKPSDSISPEAMMKEALEEGVKIALKDSLKTVVFCGVEGNGKCLPADLLEDNDQVSSLSKIWTCPGLEKDDVSDAEMLECEHNTMTKLMSLVGEEPNTRFELLVLDSTVPYHMLQILNSILGVVRDRRSLIRKKNVFIALSTKPEEEEWRQHFLDRYRKQHMIDPVTRGYVLLRGGDTNVGFGVVSTGDNEVAYHLSDYAENLQRRFDKMKKDVVVDLRAIIGGEFPFMEEWEPKKFNQSDYNSEQADTQFEEQRAVGRQNIFQLVPAKEDKSLDMSCSKLEHLISWSLQGVKLEIVNQHEYSDVGDGCVVVVTCKEGSAIGVWDGREHVDINLFTFEELRGVPEHFTKALKVSAGTTINVIRDDQPRGVGRVINFPSDMEDEEVEEDNVDDDSETEDANETESDEAEDSNAEDSPVAEE